MQHPPSLRKRITSIPRTPGNILTAIILAMGFVLTILRFTRGLGGVTNLDNNTPWGLWISFDLLCGVALAAGGYTTSAACHLFGMQRCEAAVRPAVTTAFLGYAFVVFALHYDVGQPWRLAYPIFLSHGTTSVLFEVGLCVFLYLTVLFIECTPAAFEQFGWKRLRAVAVKLTLPLTILGVILSTLHQSSLGALYLISPGKVHPLWHSSFLPAFFFVSSIFAGLSMVIFESALAGKGLRHAMDEEHPQASATISLGFARGAAFIMAGYLCMRVLDPAMGGKWRYLSTGYGVLYVIELLGFVALPALLYAAGARTRRMPIIRVASVLTVLGIVYNRFLVSMVAFNWQLPPHERYFPHWMEIAVSIFLVTLIITAYRILCAFFPILRRHPEFPDTK